MKQVLLIILGLIIGLTIPKAMSAVTIMEDWTNINSSISTCVVKTNEGHYRLFVLEGYKAGGITAVKIK